MPKVAPLQSSDWEPSTTVGNEPRFDRVYVAGSEIPTSTGIVGITEAVLQVAAAESVHDGPNSNIPSTYLRRISNLVYNDKVHPSMTTNSRLLSLFGTPRNFITLRFRDHTLEKEYQANSNLKYEVQNSVSCFVASIALLFYGFLVFWTLADPVERNQGI
ncbi:hypothetical protein HDU76_001597 [Blyttiomyces sp. JEL0837]|nr:hypothetical protein HDU76_001597 [Blyttiomyces sp. JEL0837]